MGEQRGPGHVPDDGTSIDVGAGVDTDGDGRPDTSLFEDGVDLVVAIDLDGDRFADQVLRIGPDAVVREVGAEVPTDADTGAVGGLLGGAESGDQ